MSEFEVIDTTPRNKSGLVNIGTAEKPQLVPISEIQFQETAEAVYLLTPQE
jgi:hypothetical protein